VIDDEKYTKLTVEIAKYEPDVPLKNPRPGLKLFYVMALPHGYDKRPASRPLRPRGRFYPPKGHGRLTAEIDVVVAAEIQRAARDAERDPNPRDTHIQSDRL